MGSSSSSSVLVSRNHKSLLSRRAADCRRHFNLLASFNERERGGRERQNHHLSFNERERERERERRADGFLVQLFCQGTRMSYFTLLSTENWAPLREIRSPDFWLWDHVSGGCDGVLHFRDEGGKDLVWMPSQNQSKKLAASKVPRLPHASLIDFKDSAFGFDSISQDYKVVRFVRHQFGDNFRNIKLQVELYSLKNDSWKEILHVPKQWGVWRTYVYVNGRYYWRSHWATHQRNIISFDFTTEKFSQLTLPPKLGKWELLGDKYNCQLVESNGKLGIIIYTMPGSKTTSLELWVLQNEERSSWSWTREFDIHVDDVKIPLLYSSDCGVLFLVGVNYELLVYDFRIGKLKRLGIFDQHLQVFPYHVSPISVPWKCKN